MNARNFGGHGRAVTRRRVVWSPCRRLAPSVGAMLALAVAGVAIFLRPDGAADPHRLTADSGRPHDPAGWQRVDLRPLPASDQLPGSGAISVPWRLLELDAANDRLLIGYSDGDGYCVRAAHVYLAEAATIDVGVAASTRHSDGCPDRFGVGKTWVQLSAPLAGRTIEHLAADDAWAGDRELFG